MPAIAILSTHLIFFINAIQPTPWKFSFLSFPPMDAMAAIELFELILKILLADIV